MRGVCGSEGCVAGEGRRHRAFGRGGGTSITHMAVYARPPQLRPGLYARPPQLRSGL